MVFLDVFVDILLRNSKDKLYLRIIRDVLMIDSMREEFEKWNIFERLDNSKSNVMFLVPENIRIFGSNNNCIDRIKRIKLRISGFYSDIRNYSNFPCEWLEGKISNYNIYITEIQISFNETSRKEKVPN